MSRCVREHLEPGSRAVVVAVQRRAGHLAVDDGSLLLFGRSDVPLAPNALAVDVASNGTLEDNGFRVGQTVELVGDAASDRADAWHVRPDAARDRSVDWLVTLGGALTWEPRPRVHQVAPHDLADRTRMLRATVLGEGAGESLLPLLWISERDARGLVRVASPAARLLCDAAIRGDATAVARAAGGLAGLGPGLTPSGDDLLAGFVAAWTLAGKALGADRATCARVTAAVVAGGAPGASPLGRAWLEHARGGELLEPMTDFVAAFLGPAPGDLGAVASGALRVGASSGVDWMVGFLLATGALLEAMPWNRPW